MTDSRAWGTKEYPRMPSVLIPGQAVILVVEDDAGLRELYRTALRVAGYAVVAVEDGLDALRFVEQAAPAAVVLDLGLPRLGGRDVGRELAAHDDTRHIPIIVATAESGTLDEHEYACVIRKPFHPAELVAAVRRCLGRFGR